MIGIGRVCQNQDSLDWLDFQDFAAFHIRRAQARIASGERGRLARRDALALSHKGRGDPPTALGVCFG